MESRNKKCSNICVGRSESQTYAVNQSLCRQGRRNVDVEKVDCRWGGDSRVMQFPSKSRSKKFKTSLCDVECCISCGRCSSLFGARKNLVLYISLFFKSDQLWFFFIFSLRRSLIGRKITFNFIFCEKFYHFFHFGKKSRSGLHPVSALLSC